MTDDGSAIAARPQTPRLFLVFLGALIALGPLTMDAYLPALPTMAGYFDVSIVVLNNTISLYLIGFGIGQFFGGALSDQVGRKAVGLAGLVLYALATLGIARAETIETVLIMRVLHAIGGGAATVIPLAIIRDMYSPAEAGQKFAVVMLIMLLAPLLAPFAGAFLLGFSWRVIFDGLVAYAVLLIAWYALHMPETRSGPRLQISVLSTFTQVRDVINRRVDGRRIPARYAVSMATAAAVLMIFLTNASFLYLEYFGFSPNAFPFFFGASAIALMAANLTSMRMLGSRDPRIIFRTGAGVQGISVLALFLAAVSGLASIYVVVPLIMLGVGSIGLINPAGNAVYMGYFKQLSGSAASLFTTLMFFIGSGLGALTGVLFDGSLVPMAAMMLVATTVSNLLAQSVYRQPMPARD